MRLLRSVQFASLIFVIFVNLAASGFAQSIPATPVVASSVDAAIREPAVVAQPIRAFPALNLGGGLNLAYLGMFTADALFVLHRKVQAGEGDRWKNPSCRLIAAASTASR